MSKLQDSRTASLLDAARAADAPAAHAIDRGWARLHSSIASGQAPLSIEAAPPVSSHRWPERWMGSRRALEALAVLTGGVAVVVLLIAGRGDAADDSRAAVSSAVIDDDLSSDELAPRFAPAIPLAVPPSATQPRTPVTSAAPRAATSPRRRRPKAVAPHVRAVSTTEHEDALAAELRLMGEVRSALRRGNHRRAGRALDRHRREFPTGVFAAERELSRIDVACALGHRGEAETIASAYERAHPGSKKAARRLSTCASTPSHG